MRKTMTAKKTAKDTANDKKNFFINRFVLNENGPSRADILKELMNGKGTDGYKLSFIRIEMNANKSGYGRNKYLEINKKINTFKRGFYIKNEDACQSIKSKIIHWSGFINAENYYYITCYHPLSLEDSLRRYSISYKAGDIKSCSYISSYEELPSCALGMDWLLNKFLDKSILMIFERSLLLDIPDVSWSELSADKDIGLSNILLGAHQSEQHKDGYYVVGYTPSFLLYKGRLTYSVTQKKYKIKKSSNMFNFKDRKIILTDMESDEVTKCDARRDMGEYSVLSPIFSDGKKKRDPRYSRLFVLQSMRRLLKSCSLIQNYFQEDVFSGRQSSVLPTGINRPSEKGETITFLYRPKDFEGQDKIKNKDGLTVKCHDINITLSVRALDNDDYSDIPDIINNHPSGFIFVFPGPKKDEKENDIYITRKNRNTVINGGLSENVDIIEEARAAYANKEKDFIDFLRDFDFYTAMKLYQIVAGDIRIPLSQGISYDNFIAIKDKDANLEKCWTELFLKTSCGKKGDGFTFDGPNKEGWKISLNSFGSKEVQNKKNIETSRHVRASTMEGRLIFQDALMTLNDVALENDCKGDSFHDDKCLIEKFNRDIQNKETNKIKGSYYIIRTPEGETFLIKKYPGYNSLYPLVQYLGNDTGIFSYLSRVDIARFLDKEINGDDTLNKESIRNIMTRYISPYCLEYDKDRISIEDGGKKKDKIGVCYKGARLLTIGKDKTGKISISFPKGLETTNSDTPDMVDLNFMARGESKPKTYFYDYETSNGLTITQVAACCPTDGIKDDVKGSPLHEFSLYRVGAGNTFMNIGLDKRDLIHDILCFLLSLRTKDLIKLRHISHKNVLESFIDFMM